MAKTIKSNKILGAKRLWTHSTITPVMVLAGAAACSGAVLPPRVGPGSARHAAAGPAAACKQKLAADRWHGVEHRDLGALD